MMAVSAVGALTVSISSLKQIDIVSQYTYDNNKRTFHQSVGAVCVSVVVAAAVDGEPAVQLHYPATPYVQQYRARQGDDDHANITIAPTRRLVKNTREIK